MGPGCLDQCLPGSFGPDCASERQCHCADNIGCDRFTGNCSGDCESGYSGYGCVLSDPFLMRPPKLVEQHFRNISINWTEWQADQGVNVDITYTHTQ